MEISGPVEFTEIPSPKNPRQSHDITMFLIKCLNNVNDRQIIFHSEFEIALIMRRHSHDCPSSVAGENIVSDPDWNRLAINWIKSVSACENAGFFFS